MFTGIVEEIGTIQSMTKRAETLTLTIECSKILEDMHIGDSISVNGVCLTVTSYNQKSFQVDVVNATNSITLFSKMKQGTKVNLERACLPTTRLGGHIVSGHIDTTISISSFNRYVNTLKIKLKLPKQFKQYVIPKGSICINGISLTIFEIEHDEITLNIIPETVESTILKYLKQGDFVHIEFDMIGKYILNQSNIQKGNNESQLRMKLEML
ncbi:riboflavin synthase [Macrococcus sp. DPC7161]|uniref:riboflavin synthase n=1 Tax=Macrococcus sp. DPC7161 TaxID=2507060 RepID=UPI00100AE253|nr:riboflavin synthase [Macrococcus sp. DPC7161]RXK18310.1 riboflavin synthase [Macrococcus sp. DPC7161]